MLDGLLFHELVHVEQYRQLGIPRFSGLYVRGFLKGGSYEAIPPEGNAYTLEGRFEAEAVPRVFSARCSLAVARGRKTVRPDTPADDLWQLTASGERIGD